METKKASPSIENDSGDRRHKSETFSVQLASVYPIKTPKTKDNDVIVINHLGRDAEQAGGFQKQTNIF